MTRITEPKHIISLGAGVQSSTMALMAAHGEITPMPDCAIFADTQDESKSVYGWLNILESFIKSAPHPFPIHRVTKGKLSKSSLTPRISAKGVKYSKTSIPFYTLNHSTQFVCRNVDCREYGVKYSAPLSISGAADRICVECSASRELVRDTSHGMIPNRGCTYDFKIMPIRKKQREIGEIKRGQKTVGVITWIGISLDEASRMKDSRDVWCENRWPLIEMRMTRNDCLQWMQSHGYPEPPRSSCVYCPFHSNTEWRRLKDQEPREFKKAVNFEKAIQKMKGSDGNFDSVPFLHASRLPLDQVDFSTIAERNGQINLFENECEGVCGV